MADLPSTFQKVNDVEVGQDKPLTENLMTKLGSNDNYLRDNLDAEIAARAAGDAAITADVNANVKGPGPTQTLTTLAGRLNAGAVRIEVAHAFDYVTNSIPARRIGEVVFTEDTGTFRLERITSASDGNSTTPFGRVTLHNTGVPSAPNVIPYLRVEQTSANLFFKIRLLRFVAV